MKRADSDGDGERERKEGEEEKAEIYRRERRKGLKYGEDRHEIK